MKAANILSEDKYDLQVFSFFRGLCACSNTLSVSLGWSSDMAVHSMGCYTRRLNNSENRCKWLILFLPCFKYTNSFMVGSVTFFWLVTGIFLAQASHAWLVVVISLSTILLQSEYVVKFSRYDTHNPKWWHRVKDSYDLTAWTDFNEEPACFIRYVALASIIPNYQFSKVVFSSFLSQNITLWHLCW
jgi:hypothetical protein